MGVSNNLLLMVFFGIAALFFLAGLIAVIHGIKGRKIDDHPLCGKCRFDLTGLPKDQEKCPECGVNLLRGGAIIGNRRRQPKRIYLGGIAMCLSLVFCVPVGLKVLTPVDWFASMPTWFLRIQIDHDTQWADEAWQMLCDRYQRKSLSTSQVHALIDDALNLQAQLTRPWQVEAGDFIKHAHDRGTLTPKQWDAYKTVVADDALWLEIRDTVEIGTCFPLRVNKNICRMGRDRLWCERDNILIKVGDVVLKENQPCGGGEISNGGGGYTSKAISLSQEVWDQLKPGQYTVHLEMDCTIYDDVNDSYSNQPSAAKGLMRTIKQDLPWTLLPKGTSSVTPLMDESNISEVSNAIQVKRLRYHPAKKNWDLDIHFDLISVPLAYDVSIVFKDQSFDLGGITLPINRSTTWSMDANHAVEIEDGSVVDVVLTPNAKKAMRTVDLKQYWDLPVSIENVPVMVK